MTRAYVACRDRSASRLECIVCGMARVRSSETSFLRSTGVNGGIATGPELAPWRKSGARGLRRELSESVHHCFHILFHWLYKFQEKLVHVTGST